VQHSASLDAACTSGSVILDFTYYATLRRKIIYPYWKTGRRTKSYQYSVSPPGKQHTTSFTCFENACLSNATHKPSAKIACLSRKLPHAPSCSNRQRTIPNTKHQQLFTKCEWDSAVTSLCVNVFVEDSNASAAGLRPPPWPVAGACRASQLPYPACRLPAARPSVPRADASLDNMSVVVCSSIGLLLCVKLSRGHLGPRRTGEPTGLPDPLTLKVLLRQPVEASNSLPGQLRFTGQSRTAAREVGTVERSACSHRQANSCAVN
jgi:hypothetical protein